MDPIRSLTLLASSALLAGSTALAPGDNSSIPPPCAEVHALLASKQPLAKAIEAAEKETGGLAREAAFDASGDVTVHTYTPSSHFVVEVDASSGKVKSQETRARFPGIPVEGAWTELPSGLKYFDITPGTGEKPAGPATRVKVHYSGWLTDGTKVDSSVDRGAPVELPLNDFIKGWTEGVGTMKVGGKRKLIIPFDLAYGVGGRAPVVPPKATLIYDVELLEIPK